MCNITSKIPSNDISILCKQSDFSVWWIECSAGASWATHVGEYCWVRRYENGKIPCWRLVLTTWTKTYIRELLAIWDFSLKLYTYKSAKFYLGKHEDARFYWVGSDSFLLKLSFSLYVGTALSQDKWLPDSWQERKKTTAAINWIF